MKRSRALTLAGALVVVTLVGAGYALLSSRPKPVPAPRVVDATVQIWKAAPGSLAKVQLSGRPEGTLVAEQRGGAWKIGSAPPVRLSESALSQLTYAFVDLAAERVVEENPADLARYGLDPPRVVAQAWLDDGTARTFLLGDPSPTGSTYYLQAKGDPRVYSVWKTVGEAMHFTVTDLREHAISPAIYSDEIAYLRLGLRDGTVLELRRKTPAEANDYTLGGSGKYLMTRPYRSPRGVDTDTSETTIRGPAGIEIARFVDDDPKDLSVYGLDRPRAEALARDNSITLHFLFGADAASDQVYFKLADKPGVYTVEKAKLAFLEVKPFDIIEKFAFGPAIDEVDRVDVTSGGTSHVFTAARTAKDEETVTSWTGDGKALEEASFTAWFEALSRLKLDGEVATPPAGTTVVRTRFVLNRGAPRDVTIDYVPYDRNFYAAFVQGKCEFAVSRVQVDAMIETLGRLLAGEQLTPLGQLVGGAP